MTDAELERVGRLVLDHCLKHATDPVYRRLTQMPTTNEVVPRETVTFKFFGPARGSLLGGFDRIEVRRYCGSLEIPESVYQEETLNVFKLLPKDEA
jgi:hypothetical protein